jgi:hypothetical protein
MSPSCGRGSNWSLFGSPEHGKMVERPHVIGGSGVIHLKEKFSLVMEASARKE